MMDDRKSGGFVDRVILAAFTVGIAILALAVAAWYYAAYMDIAPFCSDLTSDNGKDICQQWSMAIAAKAMVWLALLQTGIGLLTLAGLALNLRQTQAALKVSTDTAKLSYKVDRAYLFTEISSFNWAIHSHSERHGDIYRYDAFVRLMNAGRTPAVLKTLRIAVDFQGIDAEPPELLEIKTMNIPYGKPVTSEKDQKHPVSRVVTTKEKIDFADGNAKCYIHGLVNYLDMSGAEYQLRFSWFATAGKHYEITPSDKHNFERLVSGPVQS